MSKKKNSNVNWDKKDDEILKLERKKCNRIAWDSKDDEENFSSYTFEEGSKLQGGNFCKEKNYPCGWHSDIHQVFLSFLMRVKVVVVVFISFERTMSTMSRGRLMSSAIRGEPILYNQVSENQIYGPCSLEAETTSITSCQNHIVISLSLFPSHKCHVVWLPMFNFVS